MRDIVRRQIELDRLGCEVAERRIGQCIRVLLQPDGLIHPNATVRLQQYPDALPIRRSAIWQPRRAVRPGIAAI